MQKKQNLLAISVMFFFFFFNTGKSSFKFKIWETMPRQSFYNYNTVMKEWKCLLSINQIGLLIIIIALLQYTADLFLVWAAVYMT